LWPTQNKTFTHHSHTHTPHTQTPDSFINSFLDEKDCASSFVFTHIFLLIGCAIPVWFDCVRGQRGADETLVDPKLLRLAGILTVGVGDAFAALVGVKISQWNPGGGLHWAGSKRTVEGSLGCFTSMYCVIKLLCWVFDMGKWNWAAVLWFLISTTMLEASTMMVDNLLLPVVGVVCLSY